MPNDHNDNTARDEIWNATYQTWYRARYQEVMAEELIARWQIVDEVTKVLVALTASSSALAGWTLWEKPALKFLWIILAGFGAFLSIISSALSVPTRLKDWADSKRDFGAVAEDLESFKYRMRIDPNFPVKEFQKNLDELRKLHKTGIDRLRNDILLTKKLRIASQQELNDRIQADEQNITKRDHSV